MDVIRHGLLWFCFCFVWDRVSGHSFLLHPWHTFPISWSFSVFWGCGYSCRITLAVLGIGIKNCRCLSGHGPLGTQLAWIFQLLSLSLSVFLHAVWHLCCCPNLLSLPPFCAKGGRLCNRLWKNNRQGSELLTRFSYRVFSGSVFRPNLAAFTSMCRKCRLRDFGNSLEISC